MNAEDKKNVKYFSYIYVMKVCNDGFVMTIMLEYMFCNF